MKNQNVGELGFPRIRLLAGLLAMAALPWFFSGCVVVAAGAVGAGAVAYVRGELSSSMEHELDAVYRAAQSVLTRQEFARIDERKTGLDAQLVYRTALDKKIEIKLEKVTERLTKVKIRVGLVGDQELSILLLEKIRAELD
jgi:hypothetical protein